MFKSADPTRRVPTYLQAHTKENVVWQLKLLGVFFVGMYIREKIEERRETKHRQAFMTPDN